MLFARARVAPGRRSRNRLDRASHGYDFTRLCSFGCPFGDDALVNFQKTRAQNGSPHKALKRQAAKIQRGRTATTGRARREALRPVPEPRSDGDERQDRPAQDVRPRRRRVSFRRRRQEISRLRRRFWLAQPGTQPSGRRRGGDDRHSGTGPGFHADLPSIPTRPRWPNGWSAWLRPAWKWPFSPTAGPNRSRRRSNWHEPRPAARACLSCEGSFHGKTLGSLSLTGNPGYQKPFQPLLGDCETIPYGDYEALERTLASRHFAAFIVEPIQGEGGMRVPPAGYLREVQSICRSSETLLIVDEVQTGLGRTGPMFAVEHEDVHPDVLTLAKSLGGGMMPIGAMLARRDLWMKAYGSVANCTLHTSTFGGGSLASAAGLAALGRFRQRTAGGERRAPRRAALEGLDRFVPPFRLREVGPRPRFTAWPRIRAAAGDAQSRIGWRPILRAWLPTWGRD